MKYLDRVYHYLGLCDPHDKPDNSKVCYTLAVFVALAMIVILGLKQVKGLKGDLSMEYVALVCLVLLFAGSLNAFKKVVTLRFGGGPAPAAPSPAPPTAPPSSTAMPPGETIP